MGPTCSQISCHFTSNFSKTLGSRTDLSSGGLVFVQRGLPKFLLPLRVICARLLPNINCSIILHAIFFQQARLCNICNFVCFQDSTSGMGIYQQLYTPPMTTLVISTFWATFEYNFLAQILPYVAQNYGGRSSISSSFLNGF